MTLTELTMHMRSFNRCAAPGSECNAWQDYLQDMKVIYGVNVMHDTDDEIDVSEETETYWTDVASGLSGDYHPETGARR